MMLALRPVRPDDAEFLFTLYAETRQDEMDAWGWDATQQQVFLKMQFHGQQMGYQAQHPHAQHHIILLEERAVGRQIVDRTDNSIHLVDIALLSESRNAGIGSTLIGDLMAEARANDWPVRLHVFKFNRAYHLYQRLGFVITGDTGPYFSMEWRPLHKEVVLSE